LAAPDCGRGKTMAGAVPAPNTFLNDKIRSSRLTGSCQDALSPQNKENRMAQATIGYERVSLDCEDLDAIHEFLLANDIVKGTDELELIVRHNWPELLHKLVPPISKMH
jgi:hypothetical protein